MKLDDQDAKEGLLIWNKVELAKVCDRCGQKMIAKGLSFFNDEIICSECKEKEKSLPEYQMTAKHICDEAKAASKKLKKRSLKK